MDKVLYAEWDTGTRPCARTSHLSRKFLLSAQPIDFAARWFFLSTRANIAHDLIRKPLHTFR